ncbi:hypothetical protein Zmor_025025 [Zophobas morio]|uniref:Uncharacterized protein n=1 Tax=Zophobas morio TaxID=2755281 RepID=A0AA38HT05_9CUCU|nr:hypothetical protein Zmor_025025 [Zophobas morio]
MGSCTIEQRPSSRLERFFPVSGKVESRRCNRALLDLQIVETRNMCERSCEVACIILMKRKRELGDVTPGGGLEVAVMVEVLSSATGVGRGFKGRGVGGGYTVLMLLWRLRMDSIFCL